MTDCFSTAYWLLINLSFMLCAQPFRTNIPQSLQFKEQFKIYIYMTEIIHSRDAYLISDTWQMSISCRLDEHTRVEIKSFYSIFNNCRSLFDVPKVNTVQSSTCHREHETSFSQSISLFLSLEQRMKWLRAWLELCNYIQGRLNLIFYYYLLLFFIYMFLVCWH